MSKLYLCADISEILICCKLWILKFEKFCRNIFELMCNVIFVNSSLAIILNENF